MLSLTLVKKFEEYAKKRNVSTVARSSRGFLTMYKNNKIDDYWKRRRNGFIARHVAKAKKDNEPMIEQSGKYKGLPTRRETALIMWAYSRIPKTRLENLAKKLIK